jgi:hypothetical protein
VTTIVVRMKPSISVRLFSEEEREALEAGLRSKDAFVMRRSQILLASSRAQSPPQIARSLGCGSQRVTNAIHAFNERELDALTPGSSRPKRINTTSDEESVEALRVWTHDEVGPVVVRKLLLREPAPPLYHLVAHHGDVGRRPPNAINHSLANSRASSHNSSPPLPSRLTADIPRNLPLRRPQTILVKRQLISYYNIVL